MLKALHLRAHLGACVWLLPLLIAASCLVTKQQYVLDLPAGALLGWLVFQEFKLAY